MMKNALLLFFILLSNAFFANVTLPAIFCDHMVLQQKSNVNFWGTADPNETITISFPSKFETATISVYNTIGQLILTKKVTNQNSKVELNGIQSGMYLYTLESNSIMQSGKISKQ